MTNSGAWEFLIRRRRQAPNERRPPAKRKSVKKKFRLDSDLAVVPKASQDVLDFLGPLKLGDAAIFDIRLCLEEALINAIKYGNRLDPALPVELDIETAQDQVRISVK